MRSTVFSLLLVAGAVIGLTGAGSAEAYHDGRIYVGIGDVSFAYGRPYWRYDNRPLHVVHERGYPRYYRFEDRYHGPAYGYPPPAYGYRHDWRRERDWRSGYPHWNHPGNHGHGHDYGHDHGHDRRHHPRRRDRRWD